MAYAGFLPSNVYNKLLIHPHRTTSNLNDQTSGIVIELQEDSDLLVQGFWDRNTDCVIDMHICDITYHYVLLENLNLS